MKLRSTYIYALLLGIVMSSCMFDYPDDGAQVRPPGEDEGDGLISIVLFADEMEHGTRAGEPTYMNLIQEKQVRCARIILYDAGGTARYVRDYDPANIAQWVENQYPVYQTKAFKVKKQHYQIAVLINYDNPWNYFDQDHSETAMSIEFRTRSVGHDKSVLTDLPLNFAVTQGIVNDYDKAKSLVMQTLTGSFDTPPSYTSAGYIADNLGFFMSNADGPADLDLRFIKDIPGTGDQAEEEARNESEQDPFTLYVERAVAKVAFFADEQLSAQGPFYMAYMQEGSDPAPDPTQVIDPDAILDAAWRTDMLNMKVYPMRKPAPIAPQPVGSGQGGSMETPESDRRDRYAADPNHTTPPSAMAGELFSIPGDIEDPIYGTISTGDKTHASPAYIGLPLKIPNGHMGGNDIDPEANPELAYDHFEYVPENTLLPENYNTAAATNILLRINLQTQIIWAMSESIGGVSPPVVEMTGDYAYYEGIIYPVGEIFLQLKRGSMPPIWSLMMPKYFDPATYDPATKTAERLDIAPFLAKFTEAEKQAFVDNMEETGSVSTRVALKEAKEIAGVKFFKGGTHYYRIPVRHFNDAQSPDYDSYGRYGVVRNNTYIVTLKSIHGAGSPLFPAAGDIVESGFRGPDKNDASGNNAARQSGDSHVRFDTSSLVLSLRKAPGL